MADEALTAGQYIKHHLQNMTYGQHADGTWGLAHSAEEAKEMGAKIVFLDVMRLFRNVHTNQKNAAAIVKKRRKKLLSSFEVFLVFILNSFFPSRTVI